MDEQVDAPEVIETPEPEAEAPVAEPQEEAVEVAPEAETPDERDQRIAELEDANKKLFARTKAAEAAKKATVPQAPEVAPTLSLADLHAIRDVHEDDIERLQKFAKDEGLSIREARKSDEWKAIEGVRIEKRSTAHAANTSNVRRGPSQVSEDALIANAEKGKLPDDDAGIARLIAAKMKQK